MAQRSPQLHGLVLSILRQMACWTQGKLEQEAGLSQGAVSRWENGAYLDRWQLDKLAVVLKSPPGWVQGMVTALAPYFAAEEPFGSPAGLDMQQKQLLEQVGRRSAITIRKAMEWHFRKRLWQVQRAAATAAWGRLRRTPEGYRAPLVAAVSVFHTWAVVERLCEESARAASHDVEDAAQLAALARIAAAHTPGAAGYQTWLAGYAAAFEGNVIRVSGDLLRARQFFVDAEAQLQTGTPVESMDQSRPIHLFAVLLKYQGELDLALQKAGQAFIIAGTALQRTRILINRADVLKRKFQFQEALDVLARARLSVKGTTERRLSWAIEFNEASYLWEAGHTEEAASRLDTLRAEAHHLGRALDEVRFRWLTARVASSQGRWVEASSLLHGIWEAMAERRIWFEAGLAVLELAGVELDRGNTREVKKLATASAYVFTAQILSAELLASIQLFWGAVRQEIASAQEARDLAQRMRRSGGGNAEAA